MPFPLQQVGKDAARRLFKHIGGILALQFQGETQIVTTANIYIGLTLYQVQI